MNLSACSRLLEHHNSGRFAVFAEGLNFPAGMAASDHQKFSELLGELDILEDAFIVDYAPGKEVKIFNIILA